MTSPAFHPNSSGLALYDSYRYSESFHSAKTTEITRQAENGSSTLRVSLHSSYEYSQTVYTPGTNHPTSVYEAPKRPPLEDFQTNDNKATEESGANSLTDSSHETLLAFIQQKLQADLEGGANQQGLQARLNEAFDAFNQGYNDGASLLESMGLFDGAVKDAVEQLYKTVQNGFDELAEKFGLETPVTREVPIEAPTVNETQTEAAPTLLAPPQNLVQDFVQENTRDRDAALVESLLSSPINHFQAEEAETRSYSLRLRTADGDFVRIDAFAGAASRYEQSSGANSYSESFSVAGLENFQFSVRGELDAEELSAINDLLGQLNDIAESFFSGDIQGAYDQALNLGYDNEEIARFGLNLQQTSYSKLENSYGEVARQDQDLLHVKAREQRLPSNRLSEFGDFIQLLENLRQRSERFQLRMAELAGFADFLAEHRFSQHPQRGNFGPFVQNMGNTLEGLRT